MRLGFLALPALALTATAVNADVHRCNVGGKAVYQEMPCSGSAPKESTAAELQAAFEREQAAKRETTAKSASVTVEKDTAASAALGQRLVQGKKICVASWMLALKDPESAKLENYEGAMVTNDEYFAQIYGRAKNSFGGYVRGTWNCRALVDKGQLKVVSIEAARN